MPSLSINFWCKHTRHVCLLTVGKYHYVIYVIVSLCFSGLLFAAPVSGQKEIIAAVPKNFPPHYLMDEQGRMTGFAIDSIRGISARAGLRVRYLVKDTWKEVDVALRSGEADIIPNLGITKGRLERFDFSRPMETYPVSIFVRSEADYISGISDLSDREVAVVEYNIGAKILASYPDIKLKRFVKSQEALFELLSGNVDAFAYPAPGVERMIGKANLEGRIKSVGTPLREIKRGIAVLKGNNELLELLDQALAGFLTSNEYKQIYTRWYGTPSEYWTADRVLMAMASLLALLFVSMFVWRYRSLLRVNRELAATNTEKRQAQDAVRRYEEQINLLMKSTTEAMYGIGPDGKCTFANPVCVNILGYEEISELLGKNMHELAHHSYRDGRPCPEDKSYISRAFHKGEGIHVDDEVIWRADGTAFDVEYWFYPTFEHGELTGGIVSFIDITDRKQAEQKLRESEARLNKAQQIARLGNWELDLESNKLIVSDEVYRIFEVKRGSFGVSYDLFINAVHPDDYELAKQARARSEKSKSPQQVVYRLALANGRIRYVREICETLFGAQGEAVSQSGTVQDITDTVLAEEELKKHREHLQELVEERTGELEEARDEAVEATLAKSGFLASMSHELRTPLNSIIGFTGIVRDGGAGPVNEEQCKQLGMVFDSAQHLLSLINDILDLSRVEADKLVVNNSFFEISPVLNNIAEMMQPQADEKGLSLNLEMKDAPQVINSDRGLLRQILLNLLSNAVKFTDHGDITLQCHQDGGDAVFTISDTGAGIREEDLELVFEAFHQSDSGDTRLHEGSGLGLAICKRFIEKMNGTISAESVVARGSTFTLRLPIETEQPVVSAPMFFHASPSAGRDGQQQVLIVDDQPEALELLRSYLGNGGYEVISCQNGHNAIEMAKQYQPMAITLDILMPDPDGWATLAELKRNPETSQIPVIIVSILDDQNLGATLGAVDYMQKPIEASRLLSRIDALRLNGDTDILVVEDDNRDANMIQAILRRENYRIHHVFDGAGALVQLKNLRPKLVLLDIMMPRMSGFDVIRKMRDDPELENIPVIVVSGKDLSQAEMEYLRTNAREVLLKGQFTQKDMLAKINKALDGLDSKADTEMVLAAQTTVVEQANV